MLDQRDTRGRGLLINHELRGGRVTANATLTSGTIASLIAGDTDYFLDIVEVQFSNNSTVGVGVDLGNDGSVSRHVDIPASSTVQLMFVNPHKQGVKNLPWTVQMDDVTGTTVKISATLIKESGK